MAINIPEGTLKKRWEALDTKRVEKLDRSRACSAISIPTLLPPLNHSEPDPLIQQYSSVQSRGITALASKILSVLIPLNDAPFFRFGLKNGRKPELNVHEYLESLANQIYKKLLSKNMRESIYLALQHLVVIGDVLLVFDNDYSFRVIRLDQYCIRRNVKGDVQEVMYIEHVASPNDEPVDDDWYRAGDNSQQGYETVYIRVTKEEDGRWYMCKEYDEEVFDEGYFEVSPFIALRWSSIAGEDYGRSHVEDIYGDIASLEAYSRSLVQGMSAGSTFFMGVDPAGLTEIDDLSIASNGEWVPAREQDIYTISPSKTMNPQLQASQAAVEAMRAEVGKGFLLQTASMPTGERVTATAVRAVGNELETVLGGTFSSIARDLMAPVVRRAIYIMQSNQEIDPAMEDQFDEEEGILNIEIITGLQALSRESDLTKLLQLGEMVRNLPEGAAMSFKWDEYARSVILALGFDPSNWVKSEEEVMQMQQQMAAAQAQQQQQAQMQQILGSQVADVAGHAARKAVDDGQGLPQEFVDKARGMFNV